MFLHGCTWIAPVQIKRYSKDIVKKNDSSEKTTLVACTFLVTFLHMTFLVTFALLIKRYKNGLHVCFESYNSASVSSYSIVES